MNYGKIIKETASRSDGCDGNETPIENNSLAVMEVLIKQLDAPILNDFLRCFISGDEWDGQSEYHFMYKVWRKNKEMEKFVRDDDRKIYIYEFEPSDESISNFTPDEIVTVMAEDGFSIPDAENEIASDGEEFSIQDADIEFIDEVATNRGADVPSQADSSKAPMIVGLTKHLPNVSDILEENLFRKEVHGNQRKHRTRVERACVPSSSKNIDAKKKAIELKAERAAERERKKLLREQKKNERMVPKQRRVKQSNSLIADVSSDELTSCEFTDESTSHSTPPSTPERTYRSKFPPGKKCKMVIYSSDSD